MTLEEFNKLPENEKRAWLATVAEVLAEVKHEEQVDPYADHVYCSVCRECVTCNLRSCRDGGSHTVRNT